MANEWTHRMQDAAINPAAFALPTAANTTRSAQVDLGTPSTGGLNPRLARFEIEISAPALTVAQLANAQTVSYTVEDSATSGAAWTAIGGIQLVQTGAGGVGAAAAVVRYRLPSDAARYININATASAGAGNPSTADCTPSFRF